MTALAKAGGCCANKNHTLLIAYTLCGLHPSSHPDNQNQGPTPCLLVHQVDACVGDEHVASGLVHYAASKPPTLPPKSSKCKPCLLVHLVGASVGDEHVVSHLVHLTRRVHCAAWGVLATTVMAQHSSTPAHSTAQHSMQQGQHSAAQHTSIQQDQHTRWTSNNSAQLYRAAVAPQEEEEGVTRATQAATLQLNPASEGTHPAREGGLTRGSFR
jgi:hypothetical protein